jgi:hypothetical protein
MKKCGICLIGTWVVGLSALAWAVVGFAGGLAQLSMWGRVLAVLVGAIGMGFLFYQPPMKPCLRCLAASGLDERNARG